MLALIHSVSLCVLVLPRMVQDVQTCHRTAQPGFCFCSALMQGDDVHAHVVGHHGGQVGLRDCDDDVPRPIVPPQKIGDGIVVRVILTHGGFGILLPQF